MASRSPTGARPVRRGGPSIRWRLTVWYAGIFLVLGAALLALSYGLVSHTLGPDASRTPVVYRVPGVLARGPGSGESTAVWTQRVRADDAVVLGARRAFEAAQRER